MSAAVWCCRQIINTCQVVNFTVMLGVNMLFDCLIDLLSQMSPKGIKETSTVTVSLRLWELYESQHFDITEFRTLPGGGNLACNLDSVLGTSLLMSPHARPHLTMLSEACGRKEFNGSGWEHSLGGIWRTPVEFSCFLAFLPRYTVLHSGHHQELEKLPIHNDPESLESCFWLRTWLMIKPFIPIHVCMNRTPWHLSWPSSPPMRHEAVGPRAQGKYMERTVGEDPRPEYGGSWSWEGTSGNPRSSLPSSAEVASSIASLKSDQSLLAHLLG